ncbi:MAG: cation diffusion facilitator family transporter [Pirellulaceae bacterium]|nr:cation transporter [Planctomycetales bacterium]
MASPHANSKITDAAGRGVRAIVRAILSSIILASIKVVGGILGNSYALIADGVESMLDILSSLVVLGSLKISAQPANDRHPYGYGKVEPLAALVVATALLVAAVGIGIQSVREIRTPHHAPAVFTLVILVVVVITKESMFRVLRGTGQSIGSDSMQVDAWHHRSDSLTSVAAFIGISIALVAGPGYEAADDWAALFAAVVIAYNGVRLFRSSWREVLDVAPPPEVMENVRAISASVDGVHGIDKCRIRKSGLGMFVDIHVVVDGCMTVREGHRLSHRVKDRLLEKVDGVQDVLVHIEPAADGAGVVARH